LFLGVILPEATLLGDSERSKRIKKTAYKSFLMACPLLIVSMFMGMHYGHVENVDNLKQINNNIDNYNSIVSSLKSGDDNLLPLLPALDKLVQSRNLYTTSDQWGLHFLLASHIIRNALNQTIQNSLHSLFLPRIAAQIEDSMNHNIADQNLLYATLKGYLAFSASDYSNQYSIKAPVEYTWNKEFIKNPETISRLKSYLNISMRRDVEKLPLDKNLINRIRSQLAQVDPSQRAYGLLSLRASVVNSAPDIIIPAAVEHFSTLFDSTTELKVSALYTQKGFENIFLKQYRPITSEVAEDNKAIGLSHNEKENETVGQLRVNVEHMYNNNYVKTWNDTLANIKVKQFNNLDDAVNVLSTIISKQSPMPPLLNLIYDNTYDIGSNNIDVKKDFSAVNHYISKGSGRPSWNDTATILSKLHDYMVTLQKAPDQDKACFDAAENVIQNSKNDPLQQLTVMAQASPEPLKRWMLSLADNCWGVIVTGAHKYMNNAWQNTVFTDYSAGIRNRYPIKRNANANVSIADFNNFFSKGGSLDTYFNTYIKPFVNTDEKTWKLYTVNNRTIEFPQSTIDVFQKAQKIGNTFFPHGSKQAAISIVIKPLTLSNNAASVKFKAGPNELDYSHGPQYVSHWNWPLASDSDDASIILTSFSGQQYSHYGSGPWSIFQMFSHGKFNNTHTNGTYIFRVSMHGLVASYLVSGPGDVSVLKLAHLTGFVLHDLVVPVTRVRKKVV
jgi:type VI secretion system protein ImpL